MPLTLPKNLKVLFSNQFQKKILDFHRLKLANQIHIFRIGKGLLNVQKHDFEMKLVRENLNCLWKRAVRIAGFPCNYKVSPQFLQHFSIDRTDFPCRDSAISRSRSFYGQNICSVLSKNSLSAKLALSE